MSRGAQRPQGLHAVSRALTARYLVEPFVTTDLGPQSTLGDARALLARQPNEPAARPTLLQISGQGAYRVLFLDDVQRAVFDDAMPLSTLSRTCTTRDIVSHDTSFLETIEHLPSSTTKCLLVLGGSQVLGAIRSRSLYGVAGRLALLALLLELEQGILAACSTRQATAWRTLSPKRQLAAAARAVDSGSLPVESGTNTGEAAELYVNAVLPPGTDAEPGFITDALAATMFCDKLTMLRKLRLVSVPPHGMKHVASQLERVRNKCAHSFDDTRNPLVVTLLEHYRATGETPRDGSALHEAARDRDTEMAELIGVVKQWVLELEQATDAPAA